MSYEKLFEPIKSENVKSRIALPWPDADGVRGAGRYRNGEMLDYYEERAKGGTGLIFTEITRINDVTGAGAFAQLAASQDYHVESLKKLADRIHKHGAKVFVQLHHPGRQNIVFSSARYPYP